MNTYNTSKKSFNLNSYNEIIDQRPIKYLLLACLLFMSACSYASLNLGGLNNKQKYPTVEEAFDVNAFIKNETQIQILVSAIPNTYVYQNSFAFTINNPEVTIHNNNIQYPNGKTIIDEHYGETQVFSDSFEIILPYQADKKQDFELTIKYQGCLKDIICYPPQEVTYLLTALASSGDINPSLKTIPNGTIVSNINDQQQALNLLSDAKFLSVVGGFFLFGLLLSLTPCVLPMVPIISGIIAGHKHNMTKLHAFLLSLVYVLSMAITYMIAGILVASAGVNLTSIMQQPVFIVVVCIIFIFLAISSFGYIELKLPDFITQRLSNAQIHQKGGTYLGVAIMGFLSALVISPCATAPLSGALLYISSTGNAVLGGVALFSMGFAMGTPILLFGTSAGHFLPKAGPWMREINIFFGIVFIGMTIFLLSRIVTGPIILVMWSFLLLFYAVHLGLLEPAQHGWQRVQKGFALILAIYGGFLLAGATQYQTDVFHPFGKVNTYYSSLASEKKSLNPALSNADILEFTKVEDLTDFNNQLSNAINNKQITIVDFYADWCTSCRNIEKNVFTVPKVKKILTKFNRLKIDLTHYNDNDKQIMKALSVFNPPTFLFYDQNGQEIKELRIIGEVDAHSFYEVINRL